MNIWQILSFSILITLFSTSIIAKQVECSRVEIPIIFDEFGLPTIEIIIGGSTYRALVDLGAEEGIYFPISEIKKISGVKYTGETVNSVNILGATHSDRKFFLPALKVQCMRFNNLTGLELSPWAASLGDAPEGVEENQHVVLGRGFFYDKVVTFDYTNETITIDGYESTGIAQNYTEFKPYVESNEGDIVLQMDSSVDSYQMILDTGATSSMISTKKVNTDESFSDCNLNLGADIQCKFFVSSVEILGQNFSSDILSYPLSPMFAMDGLLGGDFMDKFVVTINFSEKSISLLPSQVSVL
ncbi:hypothetical protein DSB67_17190 [Vibrio campbellii]|uniref:hypothetical protein n=1 Tax=Vibrio campbellii TaxID=680 RepID=UPI00026C505A|nr:hypothetical protein [Vibrio campbellii]AXB33208.1 hypothetical protein DSB67_17190 [Vibrio campbellii]